MEVKVHSNQRCLPEQSVPEPQRQILSIVDASCSDLTSSGALWFFDSTPTEDEPEASFVASLRRCLNSYPQWCGCLQQAPARLPSEDRRRYGRLQLVWGLPSDPGVSFNFATCPLGLDALVPSAAERTHLTVWDGASLDTSLFLPSDRLANPLTEGTNPADPCLRIQHTAFACGGWALGIEITHVLADAQSLSQFANDWAATHRSLCCAASSQIRPSPVFEPALIDRVAAASGSLAVDPVLVERALNLPMHRYDRWTSFPQRIPAELRALDPTFSVEPARTPMPWHEWSTSAPASNRIFHFSQAQLARLHSRACSTTTPDPRPSRQDALVAHIWSAVARARGLADDHAPIFCDMSLGLRPRLSLDPAMLGSNMLIAYATAPGSVVARGDPSLAQDIRRVVRQFDASAVQAHLHALANEATPQRLWQAFLGRRHLIVTSWVRSGATDVRFDRVRSLRHVQPIMPLVDGCVALLETPAPASGEGQANARRWAEAGVDVMVCLESAAMDALVRDSLLFP